MKKSLLCLAGCFIAGIALAQTTTELPAGEKKLLLKISHVECPESRTDKAINLPPLPMDTQSVPYSEADIAKATPERAAEMAKENAEKLKTNRKIQAEHAFRNWTVADEHMRGLRVKLNGTSYGRQLLMAVDKFTGVAGQKFNPECIEFFHRMDNDEGQKEKFLQDMGDPETLACAYFIKLVFDDPREESGKVTTAGQEMTRKKITIHLTYQVQDLSGKVAAAGNVKCQKMISGSAAVSREGREEGVIVELLEECLEKAAEKINDHFVAKVVFKALSAQKKDENFDENSATLEIDGTTRQLGEEVSLLKGDHIVKVSMEGYKQKGSERLKISKSGERKIVMLSTMCALTVSVKGDASFDSSSATIELVAGENTESLTAGEPISVTRGKYVLKVSADGYETKTQNIVLSRPQQTVQVSLKKAAAATAEEK